LGEGCLLTFKKGETLELRKAEFGTYRPSTIVEPSQLKTGQPTTGLNRAEKPLSAGERAADVSVSYKVKSIVETAIAAEEQRLKASDFLWGDYQRIERQECQIQQDNSSMPSFIQEFIRSPLPPIMPDSDILKHEEEAKVILPPEEDSDSQI
jgi:hypothetical protein